MNNVTAISVENNSGMSYSTLIPVRMGELGGEVAQLCSARDLHICLGVGRRFATWIVERIAEYGFVEGSDFASRNGEAKSGGRGGHNRKEYELSVDMAKELAMVERTEAGRRIRRYFIDCEKQLRKIAPDVAAECLRKALNPEQQHALSGKVHSKVACLDQARRRAGYSELWSNLKARHQVAQYRDIPQSEFDDACSFVDGYAWEGDWLGKEEKPSALVLDQYQAQYINHLMHYSAWVCFRWEQGISAGLKAMNPKFHAKTWEFFQCLQRSVSSLERAAPELVASLRSGEGRGLRPDECIATGHPVGHPAD